MEINRLEDNVWSFDKKITQSQFEQIGSRKNLAKFGEDISAEYFVNKGYVILERNFHFFRQGEVDLIVAKGELVVFVEVKARTSSNFKNTNSSGFYQLGASTAIESGLAAITWKKQNRIKACTGAYFMNNRNARAIRYDVIVVELLPGSASCLHIEGAFN